VDAIFVFPYHLPSHLPCLTLAFPSPFSRKKKDDLLTSDRRQSRDTDLITPGPGKLQLIFTPEGGGKQEVMNLYDFKGKGVAMSIYNTDKVSLSSSLLSSLSLVLVPHFTRLSLFVHSSARSSRSSLTHPQSPYRFLPRLLQVSPPKAHAG
jgi:hypothetical protein